MSNNNNFEKNEKKHLKATRVQEVILRPQAPDDKRIKRFIKQLGKKPDRKTGIVCWTNFKIYIQSPKIDYPFNIKLSMGNPSTSGSVFAELSLNEFLEWKHDIDLWYELHKDAIQDIIEEDNNLNKQRNLLREVENTLLKYQEIYVPQIALDGEIINEREFIYSKKHIDELLSLLPKCVDSTHKYNVISRITEIISKSDNPSKLEEYVYNKIDEISNNQH
jgi:hypothetical protein